MDQDQHQAEEAQQLAELLGVALTRRLRQRRFWTANGVRVRELAGTVAGDLVDQGVEVRSR